MLSSPGHGQEPKKLSYPLNDSPNDFVANGRGYVAGRSQETPTEPVPPRWGPPSCYFYPLNRRNVDMPLRRGGAYFVMHGRDYTPLGGRSANATLPERGTRAGTRPGTQTDN